MRTVPSAHECNPKLWPSASVVNPCLKTHFKPTPSSSTAGLTRLSSRRRMRVRIRCFSEWICGADEPERSVWAAPLYRHSGSV